MNFESQASFIFYIYFLYLFNFLFNHIRPIEFTDLFYMVDLAKNGSSTKSRNRSKETRD